MSVTVSCGVNELTSDSLVGKTIEEIKVILRTALNLGGATTTYVDGSPSTPGLIVQDGSTVEFVKSAGEKGR